MAASPTPLDIYKHLDKSNCGKCRVKSCFAFSSLVSRGVRPLSDCPRLSDAAKSALAGRFEKKPAARAEEDEAMRALAKQAAASDMQSAASLLGGEFKNGRLIINCLGKPFFIDGEGQVTSEIHVHGWVTIPLLDYIIRGGNSKLSGKWVLFRELPGGSKSEPLYLQRCERPLQKIADRDPIMFRYVLELFGREVRDAPVSAGLVMRLLPLPKVPVLVCYSKPEDDFESQLVLFYDSNAADFVSIDSIYMLAAGMSNMFEKFWYRHGSKR